MVNERIVTISEANQNFSKVAKLCKENGQLLIYKNNKPRFVLKSIGDTCDDDMISDCEKIERLYDECKETISPSFESRFHSSLLSDNEVKKFFICVADFFLQSRQAHAIKNKRY